MGQNLRRNLLTALAVALVFCIFIALDSAIVTIELKRMAAAHELSPALKVSGFEWIVVFIASGIIPSIVLQMFRVSRYAAYLIVGALSGWFAIYSFWFEFVETIFVPLGFPPKPFSAVLVDAFTVVAFSHLKLNDWMTPACCLIGALCGWLYWLVAVRRVFRR